MTGWWSYRAGLAVSLLLQAGLVGWMIADRALLLASGTEIRLAVRPVDPRDLLRGDYVVLAYAVSDLDTARLAGDNEFRLNDPVYVTLAKSGEEWEAAALYRKPPAGGVWLKGIVTDSRQASGCTPPCTVYRADYNIEKFFVPEGTGRDLETLRNEERVTVDVAVGSGGRAAIKRLNVDGKPRYEEPLF